MPGLLGGDCMCGHDHDDHEYPGGSCSGGGWCYCQYYEADAPFTAQDQDDLNRIQAGSGDYWAENRRRFW